MSDAVRQREKVLLAAITGAGANPNWLTSDMVDALLGGHGMLNIAVINIADVLVSELKRGADTQLHLANVPHIPMEEVLAKAVKVAIGAGAAPANAALLAAVMLYLTGTKAQVGIPAGNRKLGASARLIAGVDRCGVSAIPTAKKNNKVSGFAAVMALHQAMLEGKLSPVSGHDMAVSGGPLVGHSVLGEDIIFPALASNGARIGTQAMMDAMAGAGMKPDKIDCAVFGCAAILEIVHPDADVAEEWGPHGKVTTTYVAGKAAVETAGLPPKLHVRITGQEYDTAQLVGDLGLMLKDIGGPTVIGIMAVHEMLAIFKEGISGSSAGPVNPPLGHVCADAVIAMKCLLEADATIEGVSAALRERRMKESFDPEVAMVAMNIVGKKAAQLLGGPVTSALIQASEPVRAMALYRRAAKAYDDLSAGRELAEVVRDLDRERQLRIEQNVSAFLSRSMKRDVTVRFTHIGPGARRSSKLAKQWFAFDAHLDAEITVDGVVTKLEHYADQVIPDVAQGKRPEVAWAVPLVVPLASEILLASNVVMNVTVPAAVAAAMGRHTPEEASKIAQRAAFVSSGIPGSNVNAEAAARLAKTVMDVEV
jgi:hypothetical protein